MLKLFKIAVTGSMGVGKSTICQFLKQWGAFLADSDEITHQLLSNNEKCKEAIVHLLGSGVLENSQLSRRKIAEIVFQNQKALRDLENILHPIIMQEICHQYEEAALSSKYKFFVAEIPLLFEIGAENDFDKIICVYADEELTKRRLIDMGFTEEEYKSRMQRQLPIEEKMQRSDYVIKNNRSKEDLKQQVIQILKENHLYT